VQDEGRVEALVHEVLHGHLVGVVVREGHDLDSCERAMCSIRRQVVILSPRFGG
jgi:hypothetical protein